MKNIFKPLPFFLAISLVLVLSIPNTVNASPGTSTVDSRPSAHTITGGLTVTNPTYAYDNNLVTYAQFDYDDVVGSFAVTTFSTSSGVPVSVDIKMHYEADGSGGSEAYRIIYYVGAAGPIVLQDWTYAAYGPSTRTWTNQAEPGDGSWTWTDINALRIVVETGTGGGGADRVYEHEVWVTVTIYTYTVGTMFVDPASITDPSSPFTVDINVSGVEDLYGWEFKLYYNTTILSNGSVTEGSFLGGPGPSTFCSVINNTDTYNATHGRFWVACTKLGNIAGTTGSGTLVTISFTVDGAGGTTPLDLTDTKLVGYYQPTQVLLQMNHSTTDGQVTISGLPEFPFGAALEIALVGVIVYIWWRRKHRQTPSTVKYIPT